MDGHRRADLSEAYKLALEGDPMSAFGGIVAFNEEVDAAVARSIKDGLNPTDGKSKMFYEIVIAPSYTPDVLPFISSAKSEILYVGIGGAKE